MTDDDYLYMMFGGRRVCSSRPHSLLEAKRRGLIPPQYMRLADKILASYPYPRNPSSGLSARSHYNNPGWDNVVRALEEDR